MTLLSIVKQHPATSIGAAGHRYLEVSEKAISCKYSSSTLAIPFADSPGACEQLVG